MGLFLLPLLIFFMLSFSCQKDVIFIYLSDHGGHGIFQFPHSTLYAHDLINTVTKMSANGKFSKMVIYLEACHSGSMLEELRDSNVYAVAACRPDESSYACFRDLYRNAFLADVFSAFWLHHTKRVKLTTTSFGEQFSYLLENVSEAVQQRRRKTQTPCNYGDMNLLQLPLSEFLGKSSSSIRKAYNSLIQNFQGLDVVDNTDVPLIIMENSIRNEQNPGKRDTLERRYHELKKKRKTVDEALQKIAERTNASRALSEKREVTRTYELKIVAEHFRKTLFNWEKEQFVVTRQHLQVLVNLCEHGLEVESIIQAITHVSREMTF